MAYNFICIILSFSKGIRGGISQCSLRHAKANNEYTSTQQNESLDKTYLMYWDINGLYAFSMQQKLPLSNFKWNDCRDIDEIFKMSEENDLGFILEVDLQYNQALHDLHKDYPLCAERRCPPGGKHSKLLLTLYDKNKYVIHHTMLKFVLSQGIKLQAIHRVLQFDERAWLKPYIDLNTEMRKRATNDFEKNLFKLLSNSVFGKTMENMRNRTDIKLKSQWAGRYNAGNLISNPTFKRITIFDENLVAIEMHKTSIKMFKPIAIGMAVLDISKVVMYDFHYNKMLPKFIRNPDNCRICYTDTDSFIYKIQYSGNENVYDNIIKANLNWFDTSDYPVDNLFQIPQINKKVPGLMKDECNGRIMTEFVGLRSKMYSFKIDQNEVKCKAKGVKRNIVTRKLKFSDYLNCIENNVSVSGNQKMLRSILHIMYSIEQKKVFLSPFDDKRYIMPNNIDTLPWGHYSLEQEE